MYFADEPKLSSLVILDPQFLSKVTLAGLFRLGEEEKRRDEMIFHKDLRSFWSELAQRDDFDVMAPILLELMEKFDVCFVLAEDGTKPFVEQRSILPALLPVNPNSHSHRQQASTESQEF